MTFNEEKINDFLNGRKCLTVVSIVFVVSAYVAFVTGRFTHADTGNGIFFSLNENLINNPPVSFVLNTILLLGITALTVLLNKTFNFIRSFTVIYASLFLLLQMGNPFVCTRFNAGTALCLVSVISLFVLFSTYQQKHTSQRQVFLIFTCLSFCCMFQYAFSVLAVAFIIGLFQMRGIDFRGIIAMLLGIATPFWIMIGLGIVDPMSAMPPEIEAIWASLQIPQIQLVIASTAFVAFLAILLLIINMFSFLNYRLQIRMYNSFLLVLTVVAILMMCLDYRNMMIYVPLLNWCVAIQLAHTFTINANFSRRYIPIMVLIVAVAATYAGHILVM